MTTPEYDPANGKARLFDQTGQSANTNVLGTNVTPSDSPVVWTLTTQVNTTAKVSLQEFDSGAGTTLNSTLNGGAAIDGGERYSWTTMVRDDNEYNVQYDSDVDVMLLTVDEHGVEGL